MAKLYDISDVCKLLGTTSRTLRFYEQKGIIHNTTTPFNTRRQYNEEQIKQIKNVLVLRSLGLTVAKIKEQQKGNQDLSDAITERKAQLIASMVTKTKELNLLEETLAVIESGGDIYSYEKTTVEIKDINQSRLNTAEMCTDAFIDGDYEKCFECFNTMLQDYLPLSVFKRVSVDTLKPLGKFVCKDKTVFDENITNIIYSYLKYEKLGLYIKYVFHKNTIHGIWLNYYEQ